MTTTTTSDVSSPYAYQSSETALLLLDWYTLFIEKAAGPQAAAARDTAIQFRKWAKSQGITIIHCLIDADGTLGPVCKNIERYQGFLTAMKTTTDPEPTELRDESEVYFHRPPAHVSALKSPGLLEHLKAQGIKSLVLTGLSTSGCVLRTAITATDAEFATTVIRDACADSDEDCHRVILDKILPARAHVQSTSEFQKGWEVANKA
ncbi:isochorismatase hydrolase [Fusarium sporotrichioides]|uniref:Isochorismatase hydrolase n=1 Tax=Fusarium sporotrichioides TaxID=5514 RepID=A0A395RJG3_FUSSP|nr:isochorismatase hydrolase [Fusarium sporotrichioides]